MSSTRKALDLTSIDRDPRSVTWTEEEIVCIGRHACDWCLRLTPDPTQSQLIAFARGSEDKRTIWPMQKFFWPEGWIALRRERNSTGSEGESDHLCPDCAAEAEAAIGQARDRRLSSAGVAP